MPKVSINQIAKVKQTTRTESQHRKAPEDELSIERYLGSGAVKGIGVSLAARIVRKFHEDTFRIMEEEPERLAEVKGISEKKAREIAAADGREEGYPESHDLSSAVRHLHNSCA